MTDAVWESLKAALPRAMKDRDRTAVSAIRCALSALDNAGAAIPDGAIPSAGAIEASPVGAGAAEVARRVLTAADIDAILEVEIGRSSPKEAQILSGFRRGR